MTIMAGEGEIMGQSIIVILGRPDWVYTAQVYIPKRHTLIQVLPPANAYAKSAHAYIHFAKAGKIR